MSFMKPQLSDYVDVSMHMEGNKMDDYDRGEDYRYAWRLSAPGYLDCTEWSPAESISEAISDCLGMFGDSMDLDDIESMGNWIQGYFEFRDGYLMGLAFTGNRYENDNHDGSTEYPLVSSPGADISTVIDSDEIWEKLSDEDKLTVSMDCLSFLVDAIPYLGENPDYNNAGSDFHLTRNGHGAGFWDGDWTEGTKLTELSKPYGTSKLVAYGKHIDSFSSREWEGTDRDIETSLIEYGLIWSKELDSDGARRYLYAIAWDDNGETTRYDWGCIRDDIDIRKKYHWIKWDVFCATNSIELYEWLTLPMPQKIADLLQYYGHEEIFGISYTEGTSIVTDDTDKWEIGG